MRVDTATRLVLHWQLESMRLNEAGLLSGDDLECLHNYRIAVRKTRSALAQIKGAFDKRSLRKFKSEFAWLGKITGPVRDLDVYVQKLGTYRRDLPPPLQHAIEPFRDYLARRRALEYRDLLAQLDSERYHRLLTDWAAYLDGNSHNKATTKTAGKPVYNIACRYIRKSWRSVLRHGREITPDSPGVVLHELRKDCKQLRYLMEFFRSLYPASKIRQLIASLKSLQDNLGDFQDRVVQLNALNRYTLQMTSEIAVTPETLLAIDAIEAMLRDQRDRFRTEFADRFCEFDTRKQRKKFRKLFASRE